jgi:hypothetical protein
MPRLRFRFNPVKVDASNPMGVCFLVWQGWMFKLVYLQLFAMGG